MTNAETIAMELAALLARDPSDAYVIFQERSTQKFVQFAGGADGPLFLDLPCQSLSEAEFHRAVALFHEHGEDLQEYDLLDKPGGVPVHRQFSFQLDLGDDVARAARVAADVFSRVYGFSEDFSLDVEQG